jgi:hypothetical protein
MARPPARLAARPASVTPPFVPLRTGRSVVMRRGSSGLQDGRVGWVSSLSVCVEQ